MATSDPPRICAISQNLRVILSVFIGAYFLCVRQDGLAERKGHQIGIGRIFDYRKVRKQ